MPSESHKYNSSLKTCLLLNTAQNRVITAEALNLIAEGSKSKYNYLRKTLSELVDNGAIKTDRIEEKTSITSSVKKIYSMTKKGMQTLIQQLYGEAVWQAVQTEVESATLYGANKLSATQIQKTAQITDAKTISEKAGAISREIFSDTENETAGCSTVDEQDFAEKTKSFSEVLDQINAVMGDNSAGAALKENIDSQETHLLVFTDSRTAKKSIVAESNIDQTKDFDRCAFDGILESKNRFLMMYTCFGIGRKWHKWNIDKDIAVASFWNTHNTELRKPIPFTSVENFEGVLLVKNAAQFAQIFLDSAKVRTKDEVLGTGYKNFYATPMTWDGVNHLQFLMTTDFGDADRQVAEYFIEKYGYRINNEFQPDTFFLISPENQLAINGIYMDLRRIQRAMNICDKNDLLPELICFEWQVPFYLNLNFYWQILYIQGNKIE